MKYLCFILISFLMPLLSAQGTMDPWMKSQLKTVSWNVSYKGVLADFHPITIQLASDLDQVVGYFIHDGDQRKHRLVGDWNKGDHFQLQERDENDRLTGYLVGTITQDELDMQWMSSDQSRLFAVKAFPESLIRIKNFKPVAEWIEVAATPKIILSVQKMDYGIVSGMANRNGQYTRFDGYCLDGSCSIWNTVIQVPGGAPIQVQMHQKDALNYKVTLDGTDYAAAIVEATPLMVRHFDNSMGFLDFIYPDFKSVAFKNWLSGWSDKLWTDGVNYLQTINQPGNGGRLIQRSSGWVEILEDNEVYTSGMITYINPGATRRSSFVWLKKEDVLLPMEELLNSSSEVKKLSDLALKVKNTSADEGYKAWLTKVGYTSMVPCAQGIIAATEFNMIYGDDLHLIAIKDCRDMIKRKYWNDFGW
jgi:hypothetical protein